MNKEDIIKLKKLLFRATRGKSLLFEQDLTINNTLFKRKIDKKALYMIIYPKGRVI
jgi:hypothetical protein